MGDRDQEPAMALPFSDFFGEGGAIFVVGSAGGESAEVLSLEEVTASALLMDCSEGGASRWEVREAPGKDEGEGTRDESETGDSVRSRVVEMESILPSLALPADVPSPGVTRDAVAGPYGRRSIALSTTN